MRLPRVRLPGKGTLCVLIDDRFPEGKAWAVDLRDPHDPASGQAVPEKKRRPATNAGAAVRPKDEELRHIEVLGIVSRRRAAGDQRETRDTAASADQEREVGVGLGPVERQLVVAEAAIGADLDRKDLAQIVQV